jgi:hypothetical protein
MFMLEQLTADDNYLQKILFSDEATFHTHGVVNHHSCRSWGSENPHALMEHVRDSPKVSVWFGIMLDRIVGPFFFHESTITSAVYLDMLENFVFPQIAEVDSLIFQQDGAPHHFGAIVCTALDKRFPGRWIARGGPINWPPWSPDFTRMDFFFGGTSKTLCTAKGGVSSRFAPKDCCGYRCSACGCAVSGVGWSGISFQRL